MTSVRTRRGALAMSAAALAAAFGLAACNVTVGGNTAGSSGAASSAATIHFVNSPAPAQAPALSSHYVDFSFDYPSDWTVDPTTGTATTANFVKVVRNDASQSTIENFAVGHFDGSGDAQADQALAPQLVGQVEQQLNQSIPGYKRVDTGPITFAGLPGQQLRFTGTSQDQTGTMNIFGRMIVLPGLAGTPNGVVLVMLATDTGRIINSVDDVGVKGELPVILNSFRLGK